MMSVNIIFLFLLLFLIPNEFVNGDEIEIRPEPVEVLPAQDFEKLMNCMAKKGYDVSEFRKRKYLEKIYDQNSVFCESKKLERMEKETGTIIAGCFNVKKGWVEKAIKYRDDTCLSMHEIIHEYGREVYGDDWFGLEYGDHSNRIWQLAKPGVCGCKH